MSQISAFKNITRSTVVFFIGVVKSPVPRIIWVSLFPDSSVVCVFLILLGEFTLFESIITGLILYSFCI